MASAGGQSNFSFSLSFLFFSFSFSLSLSFLFFSLSSICLIELFNLQIITGYQFSRISLGTYSLAGNIRYTSETRNNKYIAKISNMNQNITYYNQPIKFTYVNNPRVGLHMGLGYPQVPANRLTRTRLGHQIPSPRVRVMAQITKPLHKQVGLEQYCYLAPIPRVSLFIFHVNFSSYYWLIFINLY